MPSIVEECLTRIGRLPNAGVISEQHALQWVKRTLEVDPERIFWHIKRAGGIGGSESGALVAWQFNDHQSREGAERLAHRKLLMLPPSRQNDDTGRGSFLEPHIQSVYEGRLTKLGHTWQRRTDIQDLIEAAPHPKYPWLRASLDGVYEIDGEIAIVDFKAPSEDSLQSFVRHMNFDDYRIQLNHYALVAEGHGVTIDNLFLCLYDYRCVWSQGVRSFPIEISRDVQERIISATSSFWNGHIMQGSIPEATRRQTLGGAIPDVIEETARRAIIHKMIADRATKAYQDAQDRIANWITKTGVPLGEGMLPLGSFAEGTQGFLEVRTKSVLDVRAAVGRLTDLGVSPDELESLRKPDDYKADKLNASYDSLLSLLKQTLAAMEADEVSPDLMAELSDAVAAAPVKEKGDFDPDKLTSKLEELGESAYIYMVGKISSGLPRGKHRDVLERRSMVGAEMENLVSILVTCNEANDIDCTQAPPGPSPSF